MNERKSNTVQVMRGLAIIAVLIWHSISAVNGDVFLNNVGKFIICFHIPVFFTIAGYFFEKNTEKYIQIGKVRFLIKKAKHLLVPYLFWTAILWAGVNSVSILFPSVVAKISEFGFAPMGVKELLWGILTYEKYYTQHLWFVYVLFVYFLLNTFIGKIGRERYSLIAWVLIGFLTLFIDLPHILERTMLWGCFFCFGRIVATGKSTTKKLWGGILRVGFYPYIRYLMCSTVANIFSVRGNRNTNIRAMC